MTDTLKPTAPARFYGFAHDTTVSEALAALQAAKDRACTEVFASDEAECAPSTIVHLVYQPPDEATPSTSTELVHVPREEQAPLPDLQPVIDAIIVAPCTEVFAGGEAECAPSAEVEVLMDAPAPTKKKKRRTRRKLAGRRPKIVREEPPAPSLTMHEAQCGICGSDLQEEIDEEFVNWHNVAGIAREYQIERRAIYRHAHATGLFPIRDRNLRRALGLIIHRAESAPGVTADSVIRAVRTLAHINDAGEWTNPPAHVIVSSGAVLHANTPAPNALALRSSPVAKPNVPKLLDTPCQAIESVKP
jgi:hypothetical protein